MKCDDITLLYDNTKPYDSFAQILKDILIHGKDQSEKLSIWFIAFVIYINTNVYILHWFTYKSTYWKYFIGFNKVSS